MLWFYFLMGVSRFALGSYRSFQLLGSYRFAQEVIALRAWTLGFLICDFYRPFNFAAKRQIRACSLCLQRTPFPSLSRATSETYI
jgi:hypothetical protein